ncbi:MAG: DEAD/DEAH box helicase [Proteobacteria bacterium]|nr:DEAD/DEAH box helicase [Pseudomonadota bacterium]
MKKSSVKDIGGSSNMETQNNFASLNLAVELLKAIKQQGYDKPSPIQQQAIPAVMAQKDVMAAAQTGTGKTAGFTLPILHNLLTGQSAKANQARVLILTPTRELAAQVHDSVVTYGKYLSMKSAVVFGGVKINPQMMKLRRGVDILVATPGRLLDLHNQKAIKFDHLEVLVLDEADRMLDMGFIHDIRKIISKLPKKRQTLMFSATFSQDIRNLAKSLVQNPVEISVSPRNTTVEKIIQRVYPVDKKQKIRLLTYLIKHNQWSQVLVFTKTKHGANKVTKHLVTQSISALPIHGNKSQAARTKALAAFKANKVQVLVATDIAARGIDIHLLPHVVNFDLPHVAEDYVHRIGRTGRAGSNGEAISLVCADEAKLLKDIERLIKKKIPRTLIDGFEPSHDVPDAQLDTRPIQPKKSKKAKTYNSQNKHRKPKDKTKNIRQSITKKANNKQTAKPNKANKVKKQAFDPYSKHRKR